MSAYTSCLDNARDWNVVLATLKTSKTIGHRDQSIGGRELVGSVKAVLVPDEYMIIHDDRLHLFLFVCDHAHTRFVLPNLSSSDLLAGAFDGGKQPRCPKR